MHLHLEPHGEGIGDDAFGQLTAGPRGLAGGDGLESGVPLGGGEGGHPGEQHGAFGSQLVTRDLSPGPVVVLGGAEDELDLVGGLEVGEIFPARAVKSGSPKTTDVPPTQPAVAPMIAKWVVPVAVYWNVTPVVYSVPMVKAPCIRRYPEFTTVVVTGLNPVGSATTRLTIVW